MKFQQKKALVVGDFMLDVYTMGEATRVSPEAPVLILRVIDENRRPGGAGNAVLNLVSLGMQVKTLGRVGKDEGGNCLLKALAEEDVDTRALVCDPHYRTPLKNRMIAQGQQVVRVDYENPTPLSHELETEILAKIPSLLENVDVVAVSDYAKGFLTTALLTHLIFNAKERNIPIIVDPKGRDFARYKGANILKPNLSEAIAAAGLGPEAPLEDIASHILRKIGCDTLIITRSKEGISIFSRRKKRLDFPAHVHEVKDVTGAGDTVLAVIAASVANKLTLPRAAKLANIAAGKAIERIGCARISLDELEPHLLEI